MRSLQDIGQHVQKPEYRKALQELIKYELQALVERLSETGEEAVVLTASLQNGTSTQLASPKAEGFLLKQTSLGTEFLNYFNDDAENSSADELCSDGEDIDLGSTSTTLPNITNTAQFGATKDNVQGKEKSPGSRERTTSRRLSLSREDQKSHDLYEVSQTSDLSASERNDSASSVASFVEAQEQERRTNNLQCKVCDRTFRSYKTLNLHMRRHLVKSYKCNLCGKIFSLKSSYQRHIKTHNKQKTYECGFCDESFADRASWKRHRERHFGARNYSCNLCGKAFYEKYSLKVHQTSHFISNQRVDKNVDSNAGFSCHICQKLLKTKAALKKHILTHSAKKYACEFCNKRFSLKYSYVRHRRLHTGETPYKCGSCGKQFSDSSAWAKHVRTHSGVKPYSCHICSKSFYDRTACKTHMKTHNIKMGKQFESMTSNFQLGSEESIKESFKDYHICHNQTKEKKVMDVNSEIKTANKEPFVQLSMPLDDIDREFETSTLLDSGFGADLMANTEDTVEKEIDDDEQDQNKTIFDDVELDENFQKEFVERNMPLKDVESDSEFISTTFPDDSDLLDETDTETRVVMKPSHASDVPADRSDVQELPRMTKFSRKVSRRRFPESPSKCKKCHKTFKHESLLKQHLQFHCMMKLYKCRYCGKQLSTKHSLVRHERIHVGDRPYQCYICQKTFADNYGCIRHVKTHFNNEGRSVTPSNITKQAARSTEQEYAQPDIEKIEPPMKDVKTHLVGLHSPENIQCSVQSKSSANMKVSSSTSLDNGSIQNVLSSRSPNQPSDSSVRQNSQETKSLYRCYSCSALYSSQQDCINHIQQSCNKDVQSEYISVPHTSDSQQANKDPSKLKNIYQCSVCKLMFNEETACRVHQANSCQKPAISSQSSMPSLQQDSAEFSSPHRTDLELTANLPFQEVNASQPLVESDQECTIISDDIEERESTEMRGIANLPINDQLSAVTSTFVPYKFTTENHSVESSNIVGKHTSPPKPEVSFTGLIAKSSTPSQGKFVVTSQGISLVASTIGSMTPLPTENLSAVEIKTPKSSTKDKKASTESNIAERTCTLCNKVFTNKHILKQHVLIHMERKFGCKYCLKKFHNKYGRDRHERIHTGEKPYSCPNCKKAFSDNSTYRKHTRVCCSGDK